MAHRTGLGDLLNAYSLFNADSLAESQVKRELAAQQALWNQKNQQNQSSIQNLGLTPGQPISQYQFAKMGLNPNLSGNIYPNLVSSSINNQGAMQRHLTPNATQLATQPKFNAIQRTDSGIFQGVNQQGQAVNIPGGANFTPEPKYHAPPVSVNVINRERTKLDEALGTAAGEEFVQYKQNYAGSKKVLDNVKSIDSLLEGQKTGALAPLVLDAQKTISSFFPNATFPKLSESIGKREAAEQLAIGNAMVELSNFKGPTTDFEFNKAMQRNPSLLTTSSGRRKALMLLEKDANRAKSVYEQAVKARKAGTFDATFTPKDVLRSPETIIDQNGVEWQVQDHPTKPGVRQKRRIK